MSTKKVVAILAIVIAIATFLTFETPSELPIVAIANYGPHSSLEAAIAGTKEELTKQGFIENKTINYEIADVGFDLSLVPQMMTKLKNKHPQVIVVMATPIAQFAKGSIKDIPLVFTVVTDPVEAGLLKKAYSPDGNMTGASDKQDLRIMLQFIKKVIPTATRVGLLYSTAEANDAALVKMMKKAADSEDMTVVAIPVDQPRDVPMRMQSFAGSVDFIYVGTSGAIQPALPAIAATATKMGIPVVNADEASVKSGMVFASFGVDYRQVGINTGELVAQVLRDIPVVELAPIYPKQKEHHGFINKTQSRKFNIEIPANLANVTIVETNATS